MKNELGMEEYGRSIGGEEGELGPLHARKKKSCPTFVDLGRARLGTYHEQKKYDKKFRRFCGSHYSVSQWREHRLSRDGDVSEVSCIG